MACMLVVKPRSVFVNVTIEPVGHSGGQALLCMELLFDEGSKSFLPQCSTFLLQRGAYHPFKHGSVVVYGNELFVVADRCPETTVATAAGTVKVRNLCRLTDHVLEVAAREIADEFDIPYAKAAADRIAAALYYSAKFGAAILVTTPKLRRQIQQIQQKQKQEQQEQKPKELAELEELWRRFLELAKTIPPDQELEVEPE